MDDFVKLLSVELLDWKSTLKNKSLAHGHVSTQLETRKTQPVDYVSEAVPVTGRRVLLNFILYVDLTAAIPLNKHRCQCTGIGEKTVFIYRQNEKNKTKQNTNTEDNV